MSAPAARSHSGRCSATHFAPASPPASSSAVQVNRTSRRRPGDRVAGRVEAGRARLGGEQPDDAELHRDHGLHVDRAAAVDVAVGEVGRERVVASSARPGPGRRRGATAAGAARRRSRRRAGGRGPSRARAPARRPRARGRRPRGCAAIRRAATSSPSGASGGGGLIDRIRIRSRTVSTSSSVAAAQAASSSRCDGAAAPDHRGGLPGRDGERDAEDEAGEDEGHDHRHEQLAVVALLAEAGLRVRIAAAGDVRRLEALGPGDLRRAAESYSTGIGRQRPGRVPARAMVIGAIDGGAGRIGAGPAARRSSTREVGRHPRAGRDRALRRRADERRVLGHDPGPVAGRRRRPALEPSGDLVGRDVEVERLAVDVDDDRVALLDDRDRAAERRLRARRGRSSGRGSRPRTGRRSAARPNRRGPRRRARP